MHGLGFSKEGFELGFGLRPQIPILSLTLGLKQILAFQLGYQARLRISTFGFKPALGDQKKDLNVG